MTPERIYHRTWEAAALHAAHPPRLRHPHKILVHDLAVPAGAPLRGTVHASRWRPRELPACAAPAAPVALRDGYYDYAPEDDGVVGWHQNFADAVLFGFYGGGLFAQDEAQVAEHPVLASVREAMAAEGQALTVEPDGTPTPVLVAGVERRVAVDTEPTPDRPLGLYGNRFAAAPAAAVAAATRRLDPAPTSHILAIAAPSPGYGLYDRSTIAAVLTTAWAGYAAAVAETQRLQAGARTVVHTGFWGCGAFGGDRTLMTAVQALAAGLAGVDQLVLHVGAAPGRRDARAGLAALEGLPQEGPLDAVIDALHARGYRWGQSDGN